MKGAALRPGELVDDVLAPLSLRTIIDELDFADWLPTEIGWRQGPGAFKRGVSRDRRSERTSEVWFGEELRSRSRSPPVAAAAVTSARQPWGCSVTQTAAAPPTHEFAPLEHAPLPASCSELHCSTMQFADHCPILLFLLNQSATCSAFLLHGSKALTVFCACLNRPSETPDARRSLTYVRGLDIRSPTVDDSWAECRHEQGSGGRWHAGTSLDPERDRDEQ
jgi:hypothetical protein